MAKILLFSGQVPPGHVTSLQPKVARIVLVATFTLWPGRWFNRMNELVTTVFVEQPLENPVGLLNIFIILVRIFF